MADKTVAQIYAELSSCDPHELADFIASYRDDKRAGVVSLVMRAQKSAAAHATEVKRVARMYEYQNALVSAGKRIVVGLDEVGRGAVAGPLTVAAVALPLEPPILGVDDSKKLAPRKRERVAQEIGERAIAIGIAHIPPQQIDACGMAAALRVAMIRALADTRLVPDAVLVDGTRLGIHPAEEAIVGGDGIHACIAAASIVAKVTRDALMVDMASLYPGYGFDHSKGYASADHIAKIRVDGLTPVHRATFCHNFLR